MNSCEELTPFKRVNKESLWKYNTLVEAAVRDKKTQLQIILYIL